MKKPERVGWSSDKLQVPDPGDRLYVLVDAVSSVIFEKLWVVVRPDFKQINKFSTIITYLTRC